MLVGGAPADRAARQVAAEESIALVGPPARFVSRGGEKLEAALTAFETGVAGRRALDVGASTGGFTDCLLQRGGARVRGGRCRSGPAGLVVADRRAGHAPRVDQRAGARLGAHRGSGAAGGGRRVVHLVVDGGAGPGRGHDAGRGSGAAREAAVRGRAQCREGRGGTHPQVHADVLRRLAVGLRELGLPVVDAIPSPLLGADGNREFLLQVRRGGSAWEAARVAALAGSPVTPRCKRWGWSRTVTVRWRARAGPKRRRAVSRREGRSVLVRGTWSSQSTWRRWWSWWTSSPLG